MTRARLLDLSGFAAYFLLAAVLGRQTVLPGVDLALVWPAAGVGAAWLAVNGWSRWTVLDAVVLFVLSWLINDLTGASTVLAVALSVATVVQVLVFGFLVTRWCPAWWGFGDDPPPGVERLRDFGYLLAAALLSACVSALLGPAWVLSFEDSNWMAVGSWVVRNGIGVVAIFPLSLLLRHVVRSHDRRRGPADHGPMGRQSPVELVALVIVTGLAAWLIFFVNGDLPVPFLLLTASVWAGARFAPGIADVHAILLSGFVVVAVLIDQGPFSMIADVDARLLVVQAYIAVIVVVTLTLSIGRHESLVLSERLVASEKAATAQAALVRTIVDTMADGVSVIDTSGRVVLRNPAATDLVGRQQLDRSGAVDIDAYGIRHVDGSPMRPEESPMAIALSGESVENLELVVSNPSAPDGRLLQVTARPLPDTDPPLVVVVYHDITADRRERDELASFAGVVAHDLLNPLTIIEGWSEALLEDARSDVEVDRDMQVMQLDRIQRAAQRMQHLISDLLAYTTARNLKINPIEVDLDALAQDVARARVEASRVKGDPEPVVTVEGPLPAVLAEPVLLRQVLDNLVGNAVKYVAPGVRPEISVTAGPAHDGEGRPMVLIEIADNGIGIPEGQHARVFDTFHRAHQDGYRGTGLGLSIVKRIAERHGGSAAARDRDGGGGTTMSVTFPAADAQS